MVIDKRAQINQATGGRKLYQLLKDQMKQESIKMGRDIFLIFESSYPTGSQTTELYTNHKLKSSLQKI